MIRPSGAWLLGIVLSGLILTTGCTMDFPMYEGEREGIYSAVVTRAGLDATYYKAHLGHRIKTTAVHPDDAWRISGSTSVEPGGSYMERNQRDGGIYPSQRVNWAPTLGVFGSVGTEWLRLVGGLSGRLNIMHGRDGYREGLYSTKTHDGDPWPSQYRSRAFTQVIPGAMTAIPSVGLEGQAGKFYWGTEVGFPYQEWTVRSGHERVSFDAFGQSVRSWDVVQRDTWDGFGVRYTGKIGYKHSDTLSLFLSGYYEEFGAKFKGEDATISGVGAIVGILWKW